MSKVKKKRINPQKGQIKALEMNCIAIEEPTIQEWDNGFEYKAKTVVKVKSLLTDNTIDLVVWKNFNCHKGDIIQAIGKLEDTKKAFIGWADLTKITKRANT